MTALPKRRLSEEEYLRMERAAEFKSEFRDGETNTMAGTSEYSQMTDRIHLVSLEAELALADMYAKVEFAAENVESAR